jgi:hypothetical protein
MQYRPVMSWGNACSKCMHRPVPITGLLHALTAWDLKFQVCLRYTFTSATVQLFSCIGVFGGKVKRTSLSCQCSNYNLKSFITPVSAEMNDRPNRNKCIEALTRVKTKKSGQSYKTFYGRNLLFFVISYSVCTWQAFPA